jgi:hypothetical protein
MWDMNWKARLKRFRMPSTDTAFLDDACGLADTGNDASHSPCNALVGNLKLLDAWVVH